MGRLPADDDRVDDVGVAPQHLLDLLDEDLLAAAVANGKPDYAWARAVATQATAATAQAAP